MRFSACKMLARNKNLPNKRIKYDSEHMNGLENLDFGEEEDLAEINKYNQSILIFQPPITNYEYF
jgi:hypothetical protein